MLRVGAKCINEDEEKNSRTDDQQKPKLPSYSPSDCLKECRKKKNCKFFSVGTGNETGNCETDHVLNDNCQLNIKEDWEDASYDIYEIKGK